MKSLLKNECRRIFSGIDIKVILILGCSIAFWHFYQNVYKVEPINLDLPANVYTNWLGAGAYRMQSYWYYFIFPLLAVLPFAGTFYDDLKSGYIKSVLLRCDRKTYFMGKGIAVFLSGGIGVTVPLIFNFILTATLRPATRPDPHIGIGPLTSYIGSELYYQHPFIYTMVYLMFDFAVGGIMAVGAMLLCYYVNYKFVALLLPYVLYYFLYCLSGIFNTTIYAPNFFLIPGMGIEKINSLIFVFVITGIILIAYIWKGKHYEA